MDTQKKPHYLEGCTHTGSLDGKKVLTTWTTKKSDANRKADEFRSSGADLTRIFKDGRAGYRIVGYWS